jgi:GTP1/Obg family GTP-binding protein
VVAFVATLYTIRFYSFRKNPVAFIGTSSSGKTSLLRQLTKKDPAPSGDILRSRHGGRDFFEPKKAHIRHISNKLNQIKCSVVYVFDVSPSAPSVEKQLKDYAAYKKTLAGAKFIQVANKMDIADAKKLGHLKKNVADIYEVSASDGRGIDELNSSLKSL